MRLAVDLRDENPTNDSAADFFLIGYKRLLRSSRRQTSLGPTPGILAHHVKKSSLESSHGDFALGLV